MVNQRHNLFFYANVCHVCKSFGNEARLKRCGNCTMISYCNKEHQKLHWPQHKDLCTAIGKVLRTRSGDIFADNRNCSPERWVRAKMNFMLLVAIELGRSLEHYEEQMFKFIKACAVCHERDTKKLIDCVNCPSISFCAEHKDSSGYKHNCSSFRLCFDLDLMLDTRESNIGQTNIPPFGTERNWPKNMNDFVNRFAKARNGQSLTAQEAALHAEVLTRPLTLLYALRKFDYPLKGDRVTVHIVGANAIEIHGIEFWEILLHWSPRITLLKIILVGPELFSTSIPTRLCKECTLRGKGLLIEMHNVLYEEYTDSSDFAKPDIIVGYNVGIHECEDFDSERDTWASSVRSIGEQKCPVLLTSYTFREAEEEQKRLRMILGNVKPVFWERNPFSSLRPYRDFETEGIYYQNQYVIFYENFSTVQA